MPIESLFPRLEPLLPRVQKPIQYVGGELNSTVKDWDAVTVRWALMYPDAYEVGLPNQGVQILYEILNERDDAVAERAYAPWGDLEAVWQTLAGVIERKIRHAEFEVGHRHRDRLPVVSVTSADVRHEAQKPFEWHGEADAARAQSGAERPI